MILVDDLPPDEPVELCNERTPDGERTPRAMYEWLTWLPDVLSDAGLRVDTVQGWEKRGRPASTGGHHPSGMSAHHTGATSSLRNPGPTLGTLVRGRPDLLGPLCHFTTWYDGKVVVVAAGRANHCGKARPAGGMPGGDGNALYVGDEIDYDGTQKMSGVQYEAATVAHAAVLARLGVGVNHLNRHQDTSLTGKWDCGGVSTSQMRADAAKADLGGGDVLTDADKAWIVAAIKGNVPTQSEDVWTRYKVREADNSLTTFAVAFPELVKNVRAILAKVNAAGPGGGGGASPEQVEAVVREVFGDAARGGS